MKLVISAENGTYLAWQSLVQAHSWHRASGDRAVIVVHETGAPLHPIFERARELADVIEAPSFRGPHDYPPRNTCGSLLVAAERFPGEDLVLVDPDMIFVQPVTWPVTFAGSHYSYMTPKKFAASAVRADVPPRLYESHLARIAVGVPYFVPANLAKPIGHAWIDMIDRMQRVDEVWEDVMYSLGLAALELGVVPDVLDVHQHNHWSTLPCNRPVIHYCDAPKGWNKRWYQSDDSLEELWRGQSRLHGVGEPGSVLGEVLKQIRETGREFGFTT